MAALILGKTPCGICGLTIGRQEKYVTFPPFVLNELDPLHRFSDGAFHERCFVTEPGSEDALHRLSDLRTATGPEHRRCAVCGEFITRPDDYISFGFLSEDPAVSSLNYLQFHRTHLPRWEGLGAAHETLGQLEKSRAWRGTGLSWLVEQLERALSSS